MHSFTDLKVYTISVTLTDPPDGSTSSTAHLSDTTISPAPLATSSAEGTP